MANLFTLARNLVHAMQVWKNNKLTLNVKSVKSQFWLLTRPFNGVKLIVAKNSLKVFCIEFKTKKNTIVGAYLLTPIEICLRKKRCTSH